MTSTRTFYSKFDFGAEALAQVLAIAPLFDVTLTPDEPGFAWVEARCGARITRVRLPHGVAQIRVLTEVCEKLVPWVYFHDGEHCARSLLRQAGHRLPRLVELYRASPECCGEKEAAPEGAAKQVMRGLDSPSVH